MAYSASISARSNRSNEFTRTKALLQTLRSWPVSWRRLWLLVCPNLTQSIGKDGESSSHAVLEAVPEKSAEILIFDGLPNDDICMTGFGPPSCITRSCSPPALHIRNIDARPVISSTKSPQVDRKQRLSFLDISEEVKAFEWEVDTSFLSPTGREVIQRLKALSGGPANVLVEFGNDAVWMNINDFYTLCQLRYIFQDMPMERIIRLAKDLTPLLRPQDRYPLRKAMFSGMQIKSQKANHDLSMENQVDLWDIQRASKLQVSSDDVLRPVLSPVRKEVGGRPPRKNTLYLDDESGEPTAARVAIPQADALLPDTISNSLKQKGSVRNARVALAIRTPNQETTTKEETSPPSTPVDSEQPKGAGSVRRGRLAAFDALSKSPQIPGHIRAAHGEVQSSQGPWQILDGFLAELNGQQQRACQNILVGPDGVPMHQSKAALPPRGPTGPVSTEPEGREEAGPLGIEYSETPQGAQGEFDASPLLKQPGSVRNALQTLPARHNTIPGPSNYPPRSSSLPRRATETTGNRPQKPYKAREITQPCLSSSDTPLRQRGNVQMTLQTTLNNLQRPSVSSDRKTTNPEVQRTVGCSSLRRDTPQVAQHSRDHADIARYPFFGVQRKSTKHKQLGRSYTTASLKEALREPTPDDVKLQQVFDDNCKGQTYRSIKPSPARMYTERLTQSSRGQGIVSPRSTELSRKPSGLRGGANSAASSEFSARAAVAVAHGGRTAALQQWQQRQERQERQFTFLGRRFNRLENYERPHAALWYLAGGLLRRGRRVPTAAELRERREAEDMNRGPREPVGFWSRALVRRRIERRQPVSDPRHLPNPHADNDKEEDAEEGEEGVADEDASGIE